MACAFCASATDYALFGAYMRFVIYLLHALVVMFVTMPPRGALPELVRWLVGAPARRGLGQWAVAPTLVRPSRTSALCVLAVAFGAEAFLLVYAGDAFAVLGRWEHVRGRRGDADLSGMPMYTSCGTRCLPCCLPSCICAHEYSHQPLC